MLLLSAVPILVGVVEAFSNDDMQYRQDASAGFSNIVGSSLTYPDGTYSSRRLLAQPVPPVRNATRNITTTPIPVVVVSDPESDSSFPIGAWVGIALAATAILIAAIYYFVGHKRIRETFVLRALRKSRKHSKDEKSDMEFGSLDAKLDCPEARWVKRPTITSTHPGDISLQLTPRLDDIPYAPIDLEPDGRMSPRLPFASKQGSTPTAGTPSIASRT